MLIFAKAKHAVPVLNTPHFKRVFSYPLNLDDQGLLRATELVALPGTPFLVTKWLDSHICQVTIKTYPGKALYVDRRFLTFSSKPFPETPQKLPSKKEIIQRMLSLQGAPYIWGGNWSSGIPELLKLYPPQKKLDTTSLAKYSLQGVDCTGLLYEAADGLIPRNTSDLFSFGDTVPIANGTPEALAKHLRPLDILVWKNHFIIVIDHQRSIESHPKHGVFVCDLNKRLSEIMKTLTPVDEPIYSTSHLVARRWHPK